MEKPIGMRLSDQQPIEMKLSDQQPIGMRLSAQQPIEMRLSDLTLAAALVQLEVMVKEQLLLLLLHSCRCSCEKYGEGSA